MAIENQTETTPTDVETSELLQTIDTVQESANFEVMPDGSAVEMTEETEVMEVGFYDNLAEVLDSSTLNSIANELRDGLEKDKSSRELYINSGFVEKEESGNRIYLEKDIR